MSPKTSSDDGPLTKTSKVVFHKMNPLVAFSDRQGLRNAEQVRSLNQAVLQALQRELTKNPPHMPVKMEGGGTVLSKLIKQRIDLR